MRLREFPMKAATSPKWPRQNPCLGLADPSARAHSSPCAGIPQRCGSGLSLSHLVLEPWKHPFYQGTSRAHCLQLGLSGKSEPCRGS